jgi:hypothetical protein
LLLLDSVTSYVNTNNLRIKNSGEYDEGLFILLLECGQHVQYSTRDIWRESSKVDNNILYMNGCTDFNACSSRVGT